MKPEFKECATCAAKPGSPTLCASCLHNRELVDKLGRALVYAASRRGTAFNFDEWARLVEGALGEFPSTIDPAPNPRAEKAERERDEAKASIRTITADRDRLFKERDEARERIEAALAERGGSAIAVLRMNVARQRDALVEIEKQAQLLHVVARTAVEATALIEVIMNVEPVRTFVKHWLAQDGAGVDVIDAAVAELRKAVGI